jgi:hypothetical protein
MNDKQKIKRYLNNRLISENVFWSFDKSSCENISDWNLIKYVLIHLDLEDINKLFEIFSKKKIKKVWLEELVPQGDFYINMNFCFALLYFGIKKPKQYLKTMETKHLQKLLNDERIKRKNYLYISVKILIFNTEKW